MTDMTRRWAAIFAKHNEDPKYLREAIKIRDIEISACHKRITELEEGFQLALNGWREEVEYRHRRSYPGRTALRFAENDAKIRRVAEILTGRPKEGK